MCLNPKTDGHWSGTESMSTDVVIKGYTTACGRRAAYYRPQSHARPTIFKQTRTICSVPFDHYISGHRMHPLVDTGFTSQRRWNEASSQRRSQRRSILPLSETISEDEASRIASSRPLLKVRTAVIKYAAKDWVGSCNYIYYLLTCAERIQHKTGNLVSSWSTLNHGMIPCGTAKNQKLSNVYAGSD